MAAMMVGRQGHRTDDSGQVWFKLAQNMATIVAINRKLVEKFNKKLF
jgi:hypothetical protein